MDHRAMLCNIELWYILKSMEHRGMLYNIEDGA